MKELDKIGNYESKVKIFIDNILSRNLKKVIVIIGILSIGLLVSY